MITIFNRKKLLETFRMEELTQVRECLNSHGIDYRVKTVNRTSPSFFMSGARARRGAFWLDGEDLYEYTVFVRKEDYGNAQLYIKDR